MPFDNTRRRLRIRVLRAAVASLTALGLLANPVTPAATAAPGDPTATRTARDGGAHTVTLITGDVVHLRQVGGGKYLADVRRPGGAPGSVRVQTIGKDLYVWPDEALALVAADTVDRRLFNVSLLARSGYHDAGRDSIPLIATFATGRRSDVGALAGTAMVRELRSVNGVAVRAPKQRAREAWSALTAPAARAEGLRKVWLDGKVKGHLAESTTQIGAPRAWAAGLDGTGVKVAVLDTGVDLRHPDLAKRVSTSTSFVPNEDAHDGNGHGTHVLSTVGGSGAAAGGTERGVAPGADLISGKVLSNEGVGEDSWVIAGMEWAVAQGAKVVSMSLGSSVATDGTDPMSQAVDQLTAQSGALFVVAAGNFGVEASIGAPGAADTALTVAAVDRDDALAGFSSRGPRAGDYALKPDLAAPGVDILAAKAGGSAETGWYTPLSGTSMATPHVAGVAAILAQQHPGWGPQQLKDALMSSARPVVEADAYAAGAGRVDVPAATGATVSATGSAYFGLFGWPHSGVAPVQRTITYTNTGTSPVTLKLDQRAAIAGGPYDMAPVDDVGTAAPAGMFTLSADTVTVPARGSATVTSTARPAMAKAARRYLGQIVATDGAGAVRARTQIGLYAEDERYDTTVKVLDRNGKPVAGVLVLQRFGDVYPQLVPYDGEVRRRLRAGTYSVVTFIDVKGVRGPDSLGKAVLGDPEIVVDRDRVVVLDGRQVREATAAVPARTEDRVLQLNWYRSDGRDSVYDEQFILSPHYDSVFALPTKRVTRGVFEYETRWRKEYPLLSLTARGRDVPVLGQSFSVPYDGDDQLEVVHVGKGTAGEYAGKRVRGKAVLVTRSDELSAAERASIAAEAGARLLLVVNDQPGRLYEYVGTETGESTVPVASLTALVGRPLIVQADRGDLRLRVEGVPSSPYLYDLVDQHTGRVPADLAYRPGPHELTRVDMRFHGTRPYVGGEYRWAFRPHRPFAAGYSKRLTVPGTRVDWVSSPKGTSWAESIWTGPDRQLEMRGGIDAYRPGARVEHNWLAPVARPRNGSGFWWSRRYAEYVEFNVQPWSDNGADHGGVMLELTDRLTFDVYENDRHVVTSQSPAALLMTPHRDTIRYRLELAAQRDPAAYRLSTRTHSVWNVVAQPVTGDDPHDQLPLLQLDYDVRTDLAGNAQPGRQSVGLRAVHLPGSVGAGRVTGASFAVSYDDGATWQPVHLSGGPGDGWLARFSPPRGTAFVSLRASAQDDAGNTISQDVIRAYGLAGRHPHA